MNRRLKIIFTLSVLLNVLLIGVVAGSCYKRMDRSYGFSETRDPQLNNKIAKAMAASRKEQEAVHKQMKDAKGDLVKVLAASVFSEDDFKAASEKVYEAQGAVFKARNEATLKMARDMSPEERKEMAEHMKVMSERHERFKDGFKGKMGWREKRGE